MEDEKERCRLRGVVSRRDVDGHRAIAADDDSAAMRRGHGGGGSARTCRRDRRRRKVDSRRVGTVSAAADAEASAATVNGATDPDCRSATASAAAEADGLIDAVGRGETVASEAESVAAAGLTGRDTTLNRR